MDKKLIFFLLGFSVFYFIYYQFVLQPWQKKQPRKVVTAPVPEAPAKTTTPSPPPPVVSSPASPASVAPATPTKTQQTKVVVVDTPLYRAEFTNQGALLTSFRLKNYLDDHNKPLEMVPQETDGTERPLKLDLNDKELSKLANQSIYSVSTDAISILGRDKQELVFTFSDGQHVFDKKFEFRADNYLIDFIASAQKENQHIPVKVSWAPGLETIRSYKKAAFLNTSRALVNTGEKVEHLDPEDQHQRIGSTVKWAGVENNYFLAIFIPANTGAQPADAYMSKVSGDKKPQNVNVIVAGLRSEPMHATLFVGPKDYYILEGLNMDLKEAVDFGFFGPITKALFFTMRKFYEFTHNYGWSIVLITILVKIIFTPFTQMSFASMKKMQQMQPEMKKIQEKYAKMKSDDPRKQSMNVEVMALHKRYGVNPLGGCLPMLLQMPVLFAFYKLLSNAIELRGAPFALWLQDLSRPDPFYVTPVLMGATMFLQQKMTPVTDPMQRNMMYIMPIMFTYISKDLPSGLVLYWFLSNVLAIAHQYYFQQQQKAVPAVATKTT